MWTEPKLCMGGVSLPEKKTLPCESVEFWVQLGAGLGAFAAVLLVSLTCYFWKKNKRCISFSLSACFFSSSYLIQSLRFFADTLSFASLLHLSQL